MPGTPAPSLAAEHQLEELSRAGSAAGLIEQAEPIVTRHRHQKGLTS